MNTSICQKEHRHYSKFDSLTDDQSYPPRHKCCGCAYEQGLIDGDAGKKADPQIDAWPVSQAGSVRHKNAIEAYHLGHQRGSTLP